MCGIYRVSKYRLLLTLILNSLLHINYLLKNNLNKNLLKLISPMIMALIIFIPKPLRIAYIADPLWINSTLFVVDFLKLDIYVNNLLVLPVYIYSCIHKYPNNCISAYLPVKRNYFRTQFRNAM